LSDHLGMNDSLGRYLLKNCTVLNAPAAMAVSPLSTCLMGRIVSSFSTD
jgi:hypothetical protein